MIVGLVIGFVDGLIFGSDTFGLDPLSIIANLVLFLPGLSLLIRRLHDTDRSGWWFWIALIPVVGAIVLLVFVLLPSNMGPTRWNSRVMA